MSGKAQAVKTLHLWLKAHETVRLWPEQMSFEPKMRTEILNCNCACLEFIRRGEAGRKKAAEGEVSSSHIRHDALGPAGEEVQMSLGHNAKRTARWL